MASRNPAFIAAANQAQTQRAYYTDSQHDRGLDHGHFYHPYSQQQQQHHAVVSTSTGMGTPSSSVAGAGGIYDYGHDGTAYGMEARTMGHTAMADLVGGASGRPSNQELGVDPELATGPDTQPGSGSASGSSPKPIRRRMRMISSCLECRRRKLKCNKSQPCTNCLKFSRDCLYLSSKLDEADQMKLTEIKEKFGSLERQLERDIVKSVAKKQQQHHPQQQQSQQRQPHHHPHNTILADDVEGEHGEPRNPAISSLTSSDLTYEEDADGTDDVMDLGILVGKMRLSERIGGLTRPRLAEEIKAGLSQSDQASQTAGRPSQTLQPPISLANASRADSIPDSIPDFLQPGETYIPPTSGFFFGLGLETPDFASLLPPRPVADTLIRRYVEAVHPIARCLHWPSFESLYASFWEDIGLNYEPRPTIQAVVFATWFSAAVSFDNATTMRLLGLPRSNLVTSMKIGTETALSKANFLRTTRIDTMQAFIMYMIPLCRAEVSRAHSVLVGAAVRMAECMGLHRDGDAYGLTPLESHVRRLIWHQLCFLDIRTCEAQGPRPAIRRDDYDTKLPYNCDEEDLSGKASSTVDPSANYTARWTPVLLSVIRFEINEMMRTIWTDRWRLEMQRISLTTILTKIEDFRKRMFDKYDHLLCDRIPIQRYAKLVMHLLMYRLHAMVLAPYHFNTADPLPHRLNQVLIISGIMIIDIARRLETVAEFQTWAWYGGAYYQYQIAVLLATEMYVRPDNREADRIWSCLDFVFGLDPGMSREDKTRRILGEIMSKAAQYASMRKIRAPTGVTMATLSGSGTTWSEHVGAAKHTSVSSSIASTTTTTAHIPASSSTIPPTQQHYAQTRHHPAMGRPAEPYVPPTSMNAAHMAATSAPAPSGFAVPPAPVPSPLSGPQAAFQQPHMVYAGISNGEVLWGLPQPSADSPESGGAGVGMAGQATSGVSGGPAGGSAVPGGVNIMANFDWDAFNALFPQTGEQLDLGGFTESSIGTRWN